MLNWAEVGAEELSFRSEFLQRKLTESGFENNCEVLNPKDDDEIVLLLEESLNKFEHLRILDPLCEVVPFHLKQLPALYFTLGYVDCLSKLNNIWVAQSLLYSSLLQILSQKNRNIDLDGAVLIIGGESAARACVGVLLRVGFKQINFTGVDAEGIQELIDEFERVYFNVEFGFHPRNYLTQLPGIHSIVLNTTPNNESNEILKDLYYYNFLKQGGLVIDLWLPAVDSQLIQEAREVGGNVVEGYELAALADCIWVKDILNHQLDYGVYKEELKNQIKQFASVKSPPPTSG